MVAARGVVDASPAKLSWSALLSQGYLVYKEYSAENLYFILWLNEYEKEYRAYERQNKAPQTEKVDRDVVVSTAPEATRTASHLPEYLATSLRRGLDSFFAPDGPLELNLPRATRDKVLVEAGTTGDPKDFAPAREIVEQSLARSLSAHARSSVANAGPRRLVFCFSLGLFVFLLGLVPPLVAIGCVASPVASSSECLYANLLRPTQDQSCSRLSSHRFSVHPARRRHHGDGAQSHLRRDLVARRGPPAAPVRACRAHRRVGIDRPDQVPDHAPIFHLGFVG